MPKLEQHMISSPTSTITVLLVHKGILSLSVLPFFRETFLVLQTLLRIEEAV